MKPLTVVTFCFHGSRPIYNTWHVENMERMLRAALTVPHRFVCVTDKPDEICGVETFPIWDIPKDLPIDATHWLHNYVRLGLFGAPGAAIGERLLNIDLDAIVRGNIDDIVSVSSPFKIMRMRSRSWLQGGLFLIEPNTHPAERNPWEIFTADPIGAIQRARAFVGSDQAVLSSLFYEDVCAGRVPSWNEDDGISINDVDADWRLFFRTGKRKCWDIHAPERKLYFLYSGHPIDVPLFNIGGSMTDLASLKVAREKVSNVLEIYLPQQGRDHAKAVAEAALAEFEAAVREDERSKHAEFTQERERMVREDERRIVTSQRSVAVNYRADMTPGVTADGVAYDGIMRDVVAHPSDPIV